MATGFAQKLTPVLHTALRHKISHNNHIYFWWRTQTNTTIKIWFPSLLSKSWTQLFPYLLFLSVFVFHSDQQVFGEALQLWELLFLVLQLTLKELHFFILREQITNIYLLHNISHNHQVAHDEGHINCKIAPWGGEDQWWRTLTENAWRRFLWNTWRINSPPPSHLSQEL